jgi:phosphotriesterase-related protein
MATVETVGGAIDAEQLGRTLIHEHFRARDEAVTVQFPHVRDEQAERELALEQARGVVSHGVKTVADPAAMYLSRDVDHLRWVAEETGLQIVACTGIYTYESLPQFFFNRDADFMAGCFVHDIEQGIQGTDIKAAFIKCAADEPGVNDNIEKIHRAAARASNQTGAPIMAHSRPASQTGIRQVEIFLEEGVPPEKIQIAHTGDTDDLDYIAKLLDKGVYIGMDRYGLELFLPMDRRNATVLALLEQGHAERMFLSQDFSVGLDWFPDEAEEQMLEAGLVKDWSMTLLFEQVIPALTEGGMTEEQLRTMLEDNPKRWLGR